MENESLVIIKNSSEELKIKKKQLIALQAREVEETEKVAKLSKLLEQARIDHGTCMRSSLAGNASDQELIESKTILKGLADSLQETKETLKFIAETRPKLMSEISSLDGDRAVHRATISAKLAEEFHSEMMKNKKLLEKLAYGYAAFLSSGHYDRSWLRYLSSCFPQPSEHEMNLANEKFKASNDFMRD